MPMIRNVWAALFLSGLMATALQADISTCQSKTLAAYENQNENFYDACENGILDFYGFSLQVYDSTDPSHLSASQIELTPVNQGAGQTGVTGFSVTNASTCGNTPCPISVPAGETVTYVVDWDFEIDAGPIAGGASLGMDPPSGDITITQYYCVDSLFNSSIYNGSAPSCVGSQVGGSPPGVQYLTVSNPGNHYDSIVLNPPAYDGASVMTVIQLTGGADGANFGSVNGTSQVNPAPEPALLVPGASLLLLLIFRLRPRAVTQQH